MTLLNKIIEKQNQTKPGPENHLDTICLEMKESDKKDFLEAIKDKTITATTIADVIINENISETANKLGREKLSKTIQRFRRGETKMEVKS